MESKEFFDEVWFRAFLIPLFVMLVNVLVSLYPRERNSDGELDPLGWADFDSVGQRLLLGGMLANFSFLFAPTGAHERDTVSLFFVVLVILAFIAVVQVVAMRSLSRTKWLQVVAGSAVGSLGMFAVWGIWST